MRDRVLASGYQQAKIMSHSLRWCDNMNIFIFLYVAKSLLLFAYISLLHYEQVIKC